MGFLGLGVVLLGLVIGFVVAVEYDPEAADFRAAAEQELGQVIGVDAAGAVLTVAVNEEPYEVEVRVDGPWVGFYGIGDRATVVWLADDASSGRLDADVPATPRRARDAVAPLVLFLVGAVMITFGPDVLYLGFAPHPEEVTA